MRSTTVIEKGRGLSHEAVRMEVAGRVTKAVVRVVSTPVLVHVLVGCSAIEAPPPGLVEQLELYSTEKEQPGPTFREVMGNVG